MLNQNKRYAIVILSAVTLGGCSYSDNTESNTLSLANNDAAALDSKKCRTFGFRGWSLQRGEGTVSLSAEASMPTPAWSVVLHQEANVDNGAIELVMETIEPSGLSSSVVSWVAFDTTVNTDLASQADVSVKCAGDVIWSSQDG